jgi:hypothetical protein
MGAHGGDGGHAGGEGETGLGPAGGRTGHVSHSLLMGTINFPDNGEGQMPDLNRVSKKLRCCCGYFLCTESRLVGFSHIA